MRWGIKFRLAMTPLLQCGGRERRVRCYTEPIDREASEQVYLPLRYHALANGI